MKYYVTFGQKYRREPHPALGFDPRLPDGYLTVEAGNHDEARTQVRDRLTAAWAFIYDEGDTKVLESFHPLGNLGALDDWCDGGAA